MTDASDKGTSVLKDIQACDAARAALNVARSKLTFESGSREVARIDGGFPCDGDVVAVSLRERTLGRREAVRFARWILGRLDTEEKR